MNNNNPSKYPRILVLLAFAAACGGEADRTPVTFDAAYTPPADRFVPSAAAGLQNDDFHAIGAGRAARTPVLPTTSTARYVSSANGNDASDGAMATPWKTLQHAADNVEPGTTVWVDASGDYVGGLEISTGGAPNEWVVFAAMPGPRPRIVGNPGRAAVVDIDASWIVFAGFEIANHQRATLNDDTIGIQIEPRTGDIDHVSILGNVVHGIGPGVVEEASCYYNGHGIIAQSEGLRISNLIIDSNEIYDMYVGNSEVLVVNGFVEAFRITNNYIHDVNNIAIDVIGYEKNSSETTSNGYIADNVILDASNYWPYCSRGNCTYPAGDESSDGIYVDGGADMIIEYNIVGRADHGIELQSENGELIRNVEVRFNVVFNSNYKNFTLGPAKDSNEHDNQFIDRADLADATLEGCKP